MNFTLAITVDRRLIFAPLFCIAASIIAFLHVGSVYYLLGASHFLAYCFVALVWRPDTLLQTPEERAARKR